MSNTVRNPVPALAGRMALVTGSARGIGKAIAGRLMELGATVLIADRDADLAHEVAASFVTAGYDAHAIALDITDPASIAALTQCVDARWGRLDILVNNAAVLDSTPLADLTMEHFRRIQEVNQNGGLAVTLEMLPLLKQSPHPRIVNIASIQGVRGTVDSLAYSSAKGGVVNMSRALAVDLAPDGILVNCICPGFVDTRMALMPSGDHEHETDWFKDIYIKYGRIPLRRAAQPDDIAAATAFFCGDDCRYVTGQMLLVDGGVSATF
ncbi:hypothetical protein VW29_07580 [Devosia limi DSM 17137]|uniref:NAD(P)-dependent dehydrogenase, short-chain alcohol dehydrogenase family n=1 Tax=Devosia limi DSM 17137 TaxID=1121477 RepID=A0A0F5LSB1_9HYPH|nr:SDR family oxidoreductase [Devosia limi]KKB85181.1 hypothetical protein VW29_07580 [Devosia limi DSM 17137]SHF76223.1 NAD(P)-dependent dehydrogenase, short-chain alcohol dehydrogenase family [Devosia limi DSM 17137]